MDEKSLILVTGADGFIGRHCVKALSERGNRVRAFVLNGNNTVGIFPKDTDVVFGDITDITSVRQAAKSCSGIIHLAAKVGDAGSDALHQHVTVGGTKNILDAVDGDCRVIVITSVVNYGNHIGSHVCNETQQRGIALGPYSRAKQAQEDVAMQAVKEGKNVVIVRPTNVYGPGCRPWVHDAAELLLKGMPALIGGGKGNAGLAYVDNVVDVILGALDTEDARGRCYNACDNIDITWERYFSDLAALVGAKPPRKLPRLVANVAASACEVLWKITKKSSRPLLTHEAVNLVGSHHQVPNDRAKRELGVSPRVTYKQGMQAVAADLEQLDILTRPQPTLSLLSPIVVVSLIFLLVSMFSELRVLS